MPLLKLLHFMALICWCGALLYLPAMIATGSRSNDGLFYRDHAYLTRMVFNLLATPAALLAIGSGTVLFLRESIFAPWLIIKLTTVAGMVLCHALCGVLILRIDRVAEPALRRDCVLIGLLLTSLIGATLWLVLAKPF
ncbi:CopD family protein [Ectopseudomonas alcaliphila]|uniref:CopD family protein n=1 Tax=Ectopseudomonas alcaliphila TaxID=101564 RepID=UPI002783FE51|nr:MULTISPECIES: CopD family protein [Pseudomonas]MDP9940588.1 putative membrane protein [Pseudomonas sp. 3400]MDR7011847.1 putative membrane protein [Pseudomonas alcaliphila]